MGYQKNGDDNGRVEGTMDSLTVEHIVGKTEYFKKDQSANDKDIERNREWIEDYEKEFELQNDTEKIISEVTEDGND